MPHDGNFVNFVKRRELLKERLAETGQELDAWIAGWGENDPPTAQLAHLAGLLQIRSELFTEIKGVDDKLLRYLLELRGHPPG